MKRPTAEDCNKAFPLEERELIAEVINKLMDKFKNIVLIVAHSTPVGDATAPVIASFQGSDKFLSNVSKKMYEHFKKDI